jgi:hypothetical protein
MQLHPHCCMSVRTLHIANRSSLSDAELARLLQPQELDEIEVKNCTEVGGRVLQLLAEKYPSLKSLRWVGNGPINEEGYRAVVELLSLQALNVSGSSGFTSDVCAELLKRSRSLRCLDVSFCPVTDEAFAQITAPLVLLNLQGCSQITDKTLEFLLTQAPHLKHLLLGFNGPLSPESLKALEARGIKIHQARISAI